MYDLFSSFLKCFIYVLCFKLKKSNQEESNVKFCPVLKSLYVGFILGLLR